MNNFFGTDGIRAQVGTEPLTTQSLFIVGKAIAQWALSKYGKNTYFLLAHDTRNSCAFVKSCIKAGILASGINIDDAGILPTPALFHILKKERYYTTGIMISASHNPYSDNGIKLLDRVSGKLTVEDEKVIMSNFYASSNSNTSYAYFGSENNSYNLKQEYSDILYNLFESNFLDTIKVVLDTAHGSTSSIAPSLFKKLGAQVITLNNAPNGININHQCGATSPSALQKAVIDNKADIGFAFDGDGDRLIAVNKNGIIKDGDDILALLSNYSDYRINKDIIGTIMSNQGLEDYLIEQGKYLIRTQVGDKHILENLNCNKSTLGGEQSGHIILNNIINTGDGILVALKIIEAIVASDNWDFETFRKYPQFFINIPIKHKKDLTGDPLSGIIEEAKQNINKGRIIARYSGTEPLLRIMLEEEDIQLGQKICAKLNFFLMRELT